MGLIEDPKAAERLAEAILGDLTFSFSDRIMKAKDVIQDLATEIEEGRALFRSRVVTELYKVYDDEILPWSSLAKTRAARSSPKVDTSKMLVAGLFAIGFIAVVVWLIVR
jgi:hypothetical protein